MDERSMAMVTCVRVEVWNGAMQVAVMTANSVTTATSAMRTAVRLGAGGKSQAYRARQEERDQDSSKDPFHMVLLSPRDDASTGRSTPSI